MQMFNPNPDPTDVQKAKEALKVCSTCRLELHEPIFWPVWPSVTVAQADWCCHLVNRESVIRNIQTGWGVRPPAARAESLNVCFCVPKGELKHWEEHTKGGFAAGSKFTLAGMQTEQLIPPYVPPVR